MLLVNSKLNWQFKLTNLFPQIIIIIKIQILGGDSLSKIGDLLLIFAQRKLKNAFLKVLLLLLFLVAIYFFSYLLIMSPLRDEMDGGQTQNNFRILPSNVR